MLEDELQVVIPTEADLPDSDEQPVDNELQVLAPGLLRAILAYLWADRFDWFFGVNLGIYYNAQEPSKPASKPDVIGPDGFLSLGVERVRTNQELRLSYLVWQEQVMPQWVLEVVSRQPGGEYDAKFATYAAMGVQYYTIYNPAYAKRDGHGVFEVYRLEQGQYVQQLGNPVWMPELGLGIGHEVSRQESIERDWLFWYDATGGRYPAPQEVIAAQQVDRDREHLRRREAEAALAQEKAALKAEKNHDLLLKMSFNKLRRKIQQQGIDPENL
ncbi:MAG: Uma2 family endonuclease [Alkalinema sp. RL_2_19]|nr:Uma2 family endonuclease [Alkalinema sp. RL_2_19]